MPNIYYNPEKFGLTIVGEIEWSEGCYEFNLTVVWKDQESRLFYGDDSGCSCPSPFEEVGISDLTPIPQTQVIIDHLNSLNGIYRDRTGEIGELIQKIRKI